jgi:hypothetical protein
VEQGWLGLDELMDAADELQVEKGSSAHKSASLYIKVLAAIRDFPHPLSQLMGDALWDIVYHNLVFLQLGRPGDPMRVDISTVAQTVGGRFQQAVIQIPLDWLETFVDDPIYQVGGVLYTGSQAVDFYNGRLSDDPLAASSSTALAKAHEAELLRLAAHEFPTYRLDSYQQQLMRQFPEGLDSPGARRLFYPLAPVEAVEA